MKPAKITTISGIILILFICISCDKIQDLFNHGKTEKSYSSLMITKTYFINGFELWHIGNPVGKVMKLIDSTSFNYDENGDLISSDYSIYGDAIYLESGVTNFIRKDNSIDLTASSRRNSDISFSGYYGQPPSKGCIELSGNSDISSIDPSASVLMHNNLIFNYNSDNTAIEKRNSLFYIINEVFR